ncbi:hypothetical protein IHE55_04050 [Streptomyces pactum]|uniref:Resolvase/invertase-type recombinase catalytic domain-containing protein n=1 Tax=Streptomyces pactum TaxID=68249 RepID=A0ABS0NFR3_9ACTN|nr:hypothetical protein [Streptomyces pactum]MBH5334019.1 hypothetical protein [Streptomyces pactum]
MEPLTEHRGVSGPVVYGLLRLVKVSATRQAALHDALAEYCRRHELVLHGVFIERTAGTNWSVAFTGLLDVLDLHDTYGVVLPALSHLGTKAIAAARQTRITASGARLLLIRGARSADSGPAGHRPDQARHRSPDPALDHDTRGTHA